MSTITSFERVSPTRRFVLLLWVLLFAAIGCAEGSHVCGSIVQHPWQHGKASVEQPYPGEGGMCLICAASQVATSPIATARNIPVFHVADTLALADFAVPHLAAEVSLYSRPPPAQ